MAGLKFDKITRYNITAVCDGPLRIGSAIGGKEEVLIDPIDNTPFVQASSIAGVFRSYCKDVLMDNRWKILFGSNSVENMSRIQFEDGHFSSNCKMEYRPHVRINRATGSVSNKKIKGTDINSGQKFNLEYIGAGSEISFDMYLYEDTKSSMDLSELTLSILSAMKEGILQFGGKKSNGSGVLRLTTLKTRSYDMTTESDRKAWSVLSNEDLVNSTEKLQKVRNERIAYEITVSGTTENYIQVKGFAISGVGEGAPDSQNMKNALNEYIVPGSSLKGAIRSQMEKIAGYIKCNDVIVSSFGKETEKGNIGKPGNLIFSDTVIGDTESNDKMPIETRIHIDKFTGGVFERGLFNEKNAAGDMSVSIKILDRNDPEKTLGLLLFALRDLAIGTMNIGSGYSVGKGIVNVSSIDVSDNKNKKKAIIKYSEGKGNIEDSTGIIKSAIGALKGGCE